MPTKRSESIALCTGTALIVAGGRNLATLKTVEVLNIDALQWFSAADLPQPLSLLPAAVCGDHIYILKDSIMYTCSVSALILPHKSAPARSMNKSTEVWRKVAAPPVTATTCNCESIHGQLLAIGGMKSDRKSTTAVHMYNPTADSWEVISHMGTPQYYCIAAVLPNNQLMVVGGCTNHGATDSVELATVE